MNIKEFDNQYDLHDSILKKIIIEPYAKNVIFHCTLLIPKTKLLKKDTIDSDLIPIKIYFKGYSTINTTIKTKSLIKKSLETILDFNWEEKKKRLDVMIYTSVSQYKMNVNNIIIEGV